MVHGCDALDLHASMVTKQAIKIRYEEQDSKVDSGRKGRQLASFDVWTRPRDSDRWSCGLLAAKPIQATPL
jgi:hypothetical protein